ncbi:hypothetical protein HAX54_043901 [Datura stramonium]|uniref:Uncharacterized protein n=1 Tax=Datura stramonium TaxID=4076 RepID=A0ABS8SNP8_DATST|nr:hypothetical protein [Datura stramonium]
MLNNGTLQTCIVERENVNVVRICEEGERLYSGKVGKEGMWESEKVGYWDEKKDCGKMILKPNSCLDCRYTGDHRYEPALSYLTFLCLNLCPVHYWTEGDRPTVHEWDRHFIDGLPLGYTKLRVRRFVNLDW